ncbi:signal peptidase I [Flavobacteriales bacterium]|nr:signal peptidase I [Flavobacteriales bacterium]MDB9910210.1 signal peptidase I [Flavobacteriales bacterium]
MKKLKEILGKFFTIVAFIIFTIAWSLFVYVLEGEWLYFIPLIVGDILFWETLNYKFWKKREKKPKKKKSEVRSWIDAIGFAVIAATLLRTFLIEAYTIPTSSMEKSMLIGDFLFVSKVAYGPRVPMTPIAFPLVHHTMPIGNGKSYTEAVKLPYHRMKGLGEIERNDCVVFNWPAETLGRPVDKKENYVKRCVGVPGDKIELIDAQLMVNDAPQEEPEGMKKQWHYNVSTKGTGLNPNILYEKYDITEGGYGRNKNEYNLTLTNESRDAIQNFTNVTSVKRQYEKGGIYADYIFPHDKKFKWNVDNFGPITVPAAGETVNITTENLSIYKDIIERYENNKLEVVAGEIYINDKVATTYTFAMDYFWMMGDNRHNSADSRFWGFVPENHIVGKALFVWMSWDKNAKGLNKIRWNRLFSSVK